MSKTTYSMYHQPMNVFRNKLFMITGIVMEKSQNKSSTKLLIQVFNLEYRTEIKDVFSVYFTDKIKDFVDRFIEENYLVDITGHMVLSSKDKTTIVLDGRHISSFTNYVNTYEEPNPNIVLAKEIKHDKGLAY